MKQLLKVIPPCCFLLLLLFPAAADTMSGSPEEPGQVYHPMVIEVRGPVLIKGVKYAFWESAEPGMLLLAGDIVKTEKGGFASVGFASGSIDLYETTVMMIPSIGTRDRMKDIRDVVVREGKTLFDINPLGVERGFEFRTKNVQGGVKGTVFGVRYLEGRTSVDVFRGVVQVSDLEGSRDTNINLVAGNAVQVEEKADFNVLLEFDPETVLEEYEEKIKEDKIKEDKIKEDKIKDDKDKDDKDKDDKDKDDKDKD